MSEVHLREVIRIGGFVGYSHSTNAARDGNCELEDLDLINEG